MPTKEELQKGFRIGDWEVLPARGVLRRGDLEEKPEPKVLEVLMVLARRDGDLVTKEELIDEVWAGRPTADDPITRCLSQLRGHLGDKDRPYQYIETLTKRGYRLNQKVILQEAALNEPAEEFLAERARNQARLWMLVALVVVTVLIAVVMRSDWISDQSDVSDPGPVRSIAVLPFENLSGNPADQYLVSGFKQVLVQTLHNIPDFSVKHGRVDYPNREVTDIAQILGVDAVLSGAMQRQGDTLRINYEVANGYDGINITSGSITGPLDEIFSLQGRLATSVRNDLLGESEQQLVSTIRQPDSAAYIIYLRGLYSFERRGRGHPENLKDAIEQFEKAIQIDPKYGPAYLSLATAYALLPIYHKTPLEESSRLAIATVQQGIAVDESIRDSANAVFGFVYHKRRELVNAERAYIRATNAQVVDSNAFNWYAQMLSGVGRLDDALEQILIAHKMDPSSAVINSRVAIVYTWLGNSEDASKFLERSSRLGASSDTDLLGNALLLVRAGRVEEAGNLVSAGAAIAGGGTDWVEPVVAGILDSTLRESALIALEAASIKGLESRLEITIRALLGDGDGAMRVADALVRSGEIIEFDFLFLPELRELRQQPGFPKLMEELGVKAYWDEKGCVWKDDSIHCPN